MSALEFVNICRVVHRARMECCSFQKMRMQEVTIADARLWKLRATRMFLMTSLRFLRYFFRITNASKDTAAQSMGNATSKPTVESSPE